MKQIMAVLGVVALTIVVGFAQQTPTAQQLTITNGPGVTNLTASTAEVFWNTNENAGSLVHYGPARDRLTESAQVPGDTTDHKVQLDNLQPNTTYFFQVTSAQMEGNSAEVNSSVGTFTTPLESQAQNEHNPGDSK